MDQVGKAHLLLFNDTADLLGGDERGVLLMTEHLDTSSISTSFSCFRKGKLSDRLATSGIATHCLRAHSLVLEPRNRLLRNPFRAACFVGALARAGYELAQHVHRMEAELLYTYSMKGHLVSLAAGCWHDAAVVWDVRELFVRGWFKALLLRLASPRVAAVIVQTEQAERELQRWFPASRIFRIANCVDPARIVPVRSAASMRLQLGLSPEDFVLVSAGRISPHKGFDVLIDAVENVPRAQLLICGPAEHEHERQYLDCCRRKVEMADLSSRVRFLGYREDLVDILAASDVAVLASRSEQQSRFVMEAMVLGRPIIATDVGGMRDLMAAPTAGWVVRPNDSAALGDAIKSLAADPTLRADLGARAAERARSTFSVQRHAAAKQELLMGIIKRRRGDLKLDPVAIGA